MSVIEQLSQEIANGEGLALSQAAKLVPGRKGAGCDPSAIWRWCKTGAKSKTGQLVVLETLLVGNRYVTTRSALSRFLKALNASTAEAEQETTSASAKRAKAAADKLEAMGV